MSSLLDTIKGLAANTPAGLVTTAVSTVLDRILPEDAATRQAAAIQIMELQAKGTFEQNAELQLQTAQLEVDKAEASQPGPHFRDGAGWLCVIGMAFEVLRAPVEWGAALAGHPITLPPMDSSTTQNMLWALLGLGSMHAAPAAINAMRGNQ